MKNVISVFLASFILVTPLFVGAANADSTPAPKNQKVLWWKKHVKSAPLTSSITDTEAKGEDFPFTYKGPREPIFINGIN